MSASQAAGGFGLEGILSVLREELRMVVREELRSFTPGEMPKVVAAPLALLSVMEVAKTMGVKPPTVRAWIDSGRLLASKPGHEFRVRAEDLERFIALRQRSKESPVASVDDQVTSMMGRIGRMK